MKRLLIILVCLALLLSCASAPKTSDNQELPPAKEEKEKAERRINRIMYLIFNAMGNAAYPISP